MNVVTRILLSGSLLLSVPNALAAETQSSAQNPVSTPIRIAQLKKFPPNAPAKSPNLIYNGSFENSVDPKNGWVNYQSPNTSIPGWAVSTGNIDLWGGIKTPFGYKTIDLQGGGAGSVSQTIQTVPGATYRVKFWIGSYDVNHKKVFARAAGKRLVWPINVSGSTESPCLTELYFDFLAREPKTAIEIGSATEGSQGPVLDNVSCFKIADPDPIAAAPPQPTAPPSAVAPAPQTAATTAAASAATPAPVTPVPAAVNAPAAQPVTTSAPPTASATVSPAPQPVSTAAPPSASAAVSPAVAPSTDSAAAGSASSNATEAGASESKKEVALDRRAKRKAEEEALKEALRRKKEELNSSGYYSGMPKGK